MSGVIYYPSYAFIYSPDGSWTTIYGNSSTYVILNYGKVNIIGGCGSLVSSEYGSTINNIVEIYNSNGNWTNISAGYRGATVVLNSAQVNVTGGGVTITFASGSGNIAEIYGTSDYHPMGVVWDQVFGSNGTVGLNSSQANVIGGGNAILFASGSGNIVELYSTADNWDSVYGSNGTIVLNDAQANVLNDSNLIEMQGSVGSLLGLYGNSETVAFETTFGHSSVIGFNATDSMILSASDFSDWTALSSYMTQSGANTVITLDAANSITLTNVLASSLTSTQFSFV